MALSACFGYIELVLITLIVSYPIDAVILVIFYFCIKRFIAYYGVNREITLNDADLNIFEKYNNFLIIGSQACGKSTLAKRIKARYPHLELVELDELYWCPNWKKNNTKFYNDVKYRLFDKIETDSEQGYEYKAKYDKGVIIDGNYNRVKPIIWPLTDVVIWLDYDIYEVYYRAIKRTILRLITKEKICNGNIMTLKRMWTHWQTTVIYQVWKNHKKINQITIPNDYIKVFPDKKVIRICSPYHCNQWLQNLK